MVYLTGPVHVLADFQVEYGGFLMGDGTSYDIPPTCDFLDLAAIKSMDQARVWADGSWSGPDFADVLLPSMPVEVSGATPAAFQAAVAAFRNAFTVQASPLPLWVKLPGMAAQGIPAKTNKRSLPVDLSWSGGFASGAVQWRCPDPQWQSVPRTLTLAASGANVSGLVFPMFNVAAGTYAVPGVADFGSTAVTASTGTLTNVGNAPAWPVVSVTGPCPSFTVIIDGNTVTYGQAIPAGQTVTIDYRTGLATLTGGLDRTAQLGLRQFSAVTNTSSVLFSAASGTAAVTVADMWR